MRNASGHRSKMKMSGSEKKVKESTYDISFKQRVTSKTLFLELSRGSRAKQRKEMHKKVCCTRKSLFC